MRDIVEDVDVRPDDNIVLDRYGGPRPDLGSDIDITSFANLDVAAVRKDKEFSVDECIAPNPYVAIVSRV